MTLIFRNDGYEDTLLFLVPMIDENIYILRLYPIPKRVRNHEYWIVLFKLTSSGNTVKNMRTFEQIGPPQ